MNADRNAALYRQRMQQTNQNIDMNNPRQQQQFDPRIPPHMSPAVARPPPPGAPRSVKKLTGSSRKIPPRMDPSNSYHNIKNKEKMTVDGDGGGSGMLSGINQLVVGVIIVVALASIFVLPKQLKVFWVLVLALTFLIHLGFMLYKEWMQMGTKKDGDAKYAEWASVLLYALVCIYTAVMVGILFFMAWSLYSISQSRTNIARLDNAAIKDYEHNMSKRMKNKNKVYV